MQGRMLFSGRMRKNLGKLTMNVGKKMVIVKLNKD
jgi:hypothetical protein